MSELISSDNITNLELFVKPLLKLGVKKTFSLNKHHYIAIACSFTFFIYLFHEPTLNIVRKLLIVILGRTSLGFAINY